MFEYTQDSTLAALESLLNGSISDDVNSQAAMESVQSVIARVKNLPDTVKNRKADNAAAKSAVGSMDAKALIKKYFDIKTAGGMKLGTGAMCRTEIQKFNESKDDPIFKGITYKQSAYNGKTILIVTIEGENAPFTEVHYEKVSSTGNAVTLAVAPYLTIANVVKKNIKGDIQSDRRSAKAAASNDTNEGSDEGATESFMSAMESIDASLANIDAELSAMEAFTNDSLSKALKAFQSAVDSKCKDLNCANELYNKVAGQSEQFNNLLGTIADAIRKLGTGVYDKEGMKAVVVPAMSELKRICSDCGLSITDADDEITDDEITALRALLIGAKEIVSRKKDELTGGAGCPDPIKEAGASESFKGLLDLINESMIATEGAKEDMFEVDGEDEMEAEEGCGSKSKSKKAFEGFGVEDLVDGTIAMEGLSEVLSSIKTLPAKVKASRAADKALQDEVKSRDPKKLVKEYMDKKTAGGMKLGTGQLVKALVQRINDDPDYQEDGGKATLATYGGKPIAILSFDSDGGAFAYLYYEEQKSAKTILRTASFRTVVKTITDGVKSAARAANKETAGSDEGGDEVAAESFQSIIEFCKGIAGSALEGENCVCNGDDATKAAKDNIDNTEIYVAEDGEIEDEDEDED